MPATDERVHIYGDWFLSELCRRANGSVRQNTKPLMKLYNILKNRVG
jgi:hypothetical protein